MELQSLWEIAFFLQLNIGGTIGPP